MVSWFDVVIVRVFDLKNISSVPYSVYNLVNSSDKNLDCNHIEEFCCHFNNLKERVLTVSFLLFLYDFFIYGCVSYDSNSILYSLLFGTYFNFSHFLVLCSVFYYLCENFYFRFSNDCSTNFYNFVTEVSSCFSTTVILFNLF